MTCSEKGCVYVATRDGLCIPHGRMQAETTPFVDRTLLPQPESRLNAAEYGRKRGMRPPPAPDHFPFKHLTPREAQLVYLLCEEGLTAKDLGQRMFISTGTIKVYISRIFKKLDVRDSRHLIVRYWKNRMGQLERRLAEYEIVGTA